MPQTYQGNAKTRKRHLTIKKKAGGKEVFVCTQFTPQLNRHVHTKQIRKHNQKRVETYACMVDNLSSIIHNNIDEMFDTKCKVCPFWVSHMKTVERNRIKLV